MNARSISFTVLLLSACAGQASPTTPTEASAAPSSEAAPESAPAESSASPEETAAPAPSSPEPTAKPTSVTPGAGRGADVSCPELPKNRCKVTRGCMWNEIKKCVKEEE